MDGALTVTAHVCVDNSQTVLEPSIRIYVDSSQTVLEHHRSFTPYTLVTEPAGSEKTQGRVYLHIGAIQKH